MRSKEECEKIKNIFETVEIKYRPYIRWWLAEGSHSEVTLKESVEELYRAGIGGIEFVTLDESEYLPDRDFAWGSQMWKRTTETIVRECRKRNMSVSMSGGTHWATVNLPDISPDDPEASQELGYTVCRITESVSGLKLPFCQIGGDVTRQSLVRVTAAAIADGYGAAPILLDTDRMYDITANVCLGGGETSPAVSFQRPDGAEYLIFAFYMYGTGEYFKPSVAGKNYTVNYLDQRGAGAVQAYWEKHVLTPGLQAMIDEIDECDFYMDSLELSTLGKDSTKQLWAEDLPGEFLRRRGYDISPYLPFLIRTTPDSIEGMGLSLAYRYESSDTSAARIRNDFYQTLTELYEERFLQPMRKWLHARHMKLRAETSYGKTFEISQPIRFVDYVETENFEFGNELDLYRTMSGAAHIFGLRFSSESGAAEGNNYLRDHGFYRQMFYLQYAAGIQKTVYHGYSAPYGPQGNVEWPGYEGMMPIFSERFQDRQPSAIDYPQVNLHLSRIQKAMEMGQPQMDLAILRTDYFVNNGMFDYALEPYTNRTHQNLGYYWQDTALQNKGYTYEYFSPYLLCDKRVDQEDGILCPDTACYQAVLVIQEEFPLKAAKRLYELAKGGLSVIFVDGVEEIAAREGEKRLKYNTHAASATGGFLPEDEELADWIGKIKKLPSVKTAGAPAEVPGILEKMRIYPRVTKKSSSKNLLTALRKAEDVRYLYVYNYMYEEADAADEMLEVSGRTRIYCLNTWSGDVKPAAAETIDGVTRWNVRIKPGATALYVLIEDKDADIYGNKRDMPASVRSVSVESAAAKSALAESAAAKSALAESAPAAQTGWEKMDLGPWHLKVDAYVPGNLSQRTVFSPELGRDITEVAAASEHKWIDVGELRELCPWKGIPALGKGVSGVGIYETVIELSPDQAKKRITFCCDSIHMGTAAVWLNDIPVPFDMDAGEADFTGIAAEGQNSVRVRVAGSLRNCLIQKGYPHWLRQPEAAEYGMTGDTCLYLE